MADRAGAPGAISTNTFPSWELAHPYRMIAHNGEINTVKGNFNWIAGARGRDELAVLARRFAQALSADSTKASPNTACFDTRLELLVMAGYPLAHAMMMMIPRRGSSHTLMDESRRAFYETILRSMMEPWDDRPRFAFTDGVRIGATLDRNGLRPARYVNHRRRHRRDGLRGRLLPIAESKIVKKWRLQPGKIS